MVQELDTHEEIEAHLLEALSQMLEGTLAKNIVAPLMAASSTTTDEPLPTVHMKVIENQADES